MKSERGLTALSRARSPLGTHWPLCCHIRTAMMNPTLNSVRRTVLVKPFPSLAREGNGFTRTVLRTLLSVGFIIAVLMWQQSGQWVPSGDRARDSAVKPRSDFMIFYGA